MTGNTSQSSRYAIVYFRMMQGVRGIQIATSELTAVHLRRAPATLATRDQIERIWRWRTLVPGFWGHAALVGADRLRFYTTQKASQELEAAGWPVTEGRPPGGVLRWMLGAK